MAVPVGKLKGISTSVAQALRGQGVDNSDLFLEKVRTPADRKAVAASLGIDLADLQNLANRADLARVKGIGSVFGDLLEASGVDTVVELSRRRADNLHTKLIEVNNEQSLTKRPPTATQVEDWVTQAKALPRALEY